MFYQKNCYNYGTYHQIDKKKHRLLFGQRKAWELIKQKYIETPILISPNWQMEFHVHTNASLLVVGVMLF
jgi:hypothetical protein